MRIPPNFVTLSRPTCTSQVASTAALAKMQRSREVHTDERTVPSHLPLPAQSSRNRCRGKDMFSKAQSSRKTVNRIACRMLIRIRLSDRAFDPDRYCHRPCRLCPKHTTPQTQAPKGSTAHHFRLQGLHMQGQCRIKWCTIYPMR
jgi:hypothetical protein